MKKLKIAFFGAPSFAARVLQKIIDDTSLPATLTCVVTQPDRPAGRKQILTPTPVKLLAKKCGIPVFDDFQIKEVDLALLYAYGRILPMEILKIPKWGFWNIHPSLLPRYRGTSPVAYSLLMGDKKTGVSLMEMDERMDHGPIINQQEYEIANEDTREDLENRLSDIGYKLFKQSIQLLIDNKLQKEEQNYNERTFTRLLTKQDGFIPFAIVQKIISGESLTKDDCPSIISDYFSKYGVSPTFDFRLSTFNLFRALSPWPGLWTLLRQGSAGQARLKITGMELKNDIPTITKVQLEGKKEVDWSTFKSAYGL